MAFPVLRQHACDGCLPKLPGETGPALQARGVHTISLELSVMVLYMPSAKHVVESGSHAPEVTSLAWSHRQATLV